MSENISDRLKPFQNAVSDPAQYARKWKERHGQPVVGYFCSYSPEEIILATGALPYRIFGSQQQISLADAHLQSYSCSLVRGALEDALRGDLEFLKGTVFPHTCDSIMRLSDMWRMNLSLDFHIDIVLPVKLNTPSAKGYMHDVMKRFKRDLEKEMGAEISIEQLNSAVNIINRMRDLINDLYQIKYKSPASISGGELNTIIKGCMIMDRYEVCELLEDLVNALRANKTAMVPQGKKVLLAGGLCNIPDIFDIVEDAGGIIVADDFCTGLRMANSKVSMQGDIIEGIADRYFERVICPAKHSELYSRGDHILDLANKTNADGVIFLYLKFCDPHAFDYPYMRDMLNKAGFPNMLFEIEDQIPSEGQFRTRCEAFIEMI